MDGNCIPETLEELIALKDDYLFILNNKKYKLQAVFKDFDETWNVALKRVGMFSEKKYVSIKYFKNNYKYTPNEW